MEFCIQKVLCCLLKTRACFLLLQPAKAHRLLPIQRWKESAALSSHVFVSTFAGVGRTFVSLFLVLLPLLRVDKSDFPQSQSTQLQQRLSTEEDEQQPLPVNIWVNQGWNFSQQDSILKKPFHYESQHVLVMTAATSGKTNLDTIMISRCQGDDTFVAFQTMGIFRFWRNGKFTFFQRCLQPLYFSLSSLPTQLRWHPVLSRFYWRIQRSKKKNEKIEGCEQSTSQFIVCLNLPQS